ncbi:DUF234 domain-containing protein [Streptomyces humicola]|uniref:DUF234 domain-containing protein n=1 Tax=Streptomyces humicola TaxID=2953240 RepID=UPI003556084C
MSIPSATTLGLIDASWAPISLIGWQVEGFVGLAEPNADSALFDGCDVHPDGMSAWTSAASPICARARERTLAAELPTEAQARTVLSAIGHGERTFSLIGRAADGLNPGSLTCSLELLTTRRMVAIDLSLSTRPSRESRYRIDAPYLRFWLSFIGPGIPAVERGRGDRVLDTIRTHWTAWRGRAIEPVIREALWRLTDDRLPAGTHALGGYWTRTNDPEIDFADADRAPMRTGRHASSEGVRAHIGLTYALK